MDIDFTKGEAKEALDKAVAEKLDEATSGLKDKNKQLLAEKKALETKFEGIDPDEYKTLKAKARDADDKGKDASEIRARVEAEFTPKLTKLEQDLETERAARRKDTIERSLTEALVEANISKDLMGAAKDHILARRKVDVGDGGATIDGKAASEFVKQWATTDGKAFVAAADNSGGGAKGSKGGGAAGDKKAKDMTPAEKAAFIADKGLPAWQEKIKES